MLRLFSKIRHRLIGSSFGRYFLYAIGEIALVVIGILIALQVNNWNEGRKRIAEGMRYVTLIYEDLQKEKEFINGNISRLESQNKGVYDLATIIEVKSEVYDLQKWHEGTVKAYTPINLVRQKATWDELTSSGQADIIVDDSLKQMLENFYFEYEQDVISFNKAPSQALLEFQRLVLQHLDLKSYNQAFSGVPNALMDPGIVKEMVANQMILKLIREILVGSRVLTMTLTRLDGQLESIIHYIDKNYIERAEKS